MPVQISVLTLLAEPFFCLLYFGIREKDSISFPEPSLPLSSGAGNERLWDKAFSDDKILVMGLTAQA